MAGHVLMICQWQNVEKVAKGAVEERKIRVVFLPAEGATATPQHNNVNGTVRHPKIFLSFSTTNQNWQHLSTSSDAPPAYGTPSQTYSSPQAENTAPGARAAAPEPVPSTDTKSTFTETASNAAQQAQSTVSNATSAAIAAVPTSGDDLRAQLAQAKATIAKLTQQNEEQGLRQRKADAVNQDSRERITSGTTGMGVQQQPGDGVPVQIVAALCLLSFLLAYFLF